MKEHLREYPLSDGDEAWIVIDRDKWPDDALGDVAAWVSRNSAYGLAVSIRRFEDWLRLHVEGDADALRRYRDFLCGKDKHVPEDFVTKERVLAAVGKARRRFQTAMTVGNVFQVLDSFFKRPQD
jgi:hypothetical protein